MKQVDIRSVLRHTTTEDMTSHSSLSQFNHKIEKQKQKNIIWRYPTAWLYSEIIPCLLSIINRHHYGQLLSFLLGEANSSPWLLTGTSCQFSRERHVAAEFFQMSYLDPLSVSNKFPATCIASGWQLKSKPTASHCFHLWSAGPLILCNCNMN